MTLTREDIVNIDFEDDYTDYALQQGIEGNNSEPMVRATKVADELEDKLSFWKDCNLTYKEQLGMLKADIQYVIDTLRGESQEGKR